MFDLPVKRVMERNKFITVSPNQTISQAARLMASKHFGVALVMEGGQLLGILTTSDIVLRVLGLGLDPNDTPVRSAMTPNPITVAPGDSFGHALVVMQTHRVRHAPVVEDGHTLGLVSARTAMDPDLDEFVPEARRREHYLADHRAGH